MYQRMKAKRRADGFLEVSYLAFKVSGTSPDSRALAMTPNLIKNRRKLFACIIESKNIGSEGGRLRSAWEDRGLLIGKTVSCGF